MVNFSENLQKIEKFYGKFVNSCQNRPQISKNSENLMISGVILSVISLSIVGTFLLSFWVPFLMNFFVNFWLISACFFHQNLGSVGFGAGAAEVNSDRARSSGIDFHLLRIIVKRSQ